MSEFNPSAAFLLELNWVNLYEPADASELEPWTYRCKGCGTLLSRSERERHHRRHKRQEYLRRENEIKRARIQSLAKARKARERRAA